MARARKKVSPASRSSSARKTAKRPNGKKRLRAPAASASSKKKTLVRPKPASKVRSLKKSQPVSAAKPSVSKAPRASSAPKKRVGARRLASAPRFMLQSKLPSAYEIPNESVPSYLQRAVEVDRRLPQGYGDDRLTLLVRDPWWIYAYWEVTPQRAEQVASALPWERREERVMVLRIYDLTETVFERPHSFFDIEIRGGADCWYVDVGAPDRSWGAELGYRLSDGRFWPLVRSNVVRTPRFGFSDILDEEWMIPDADFWRLVGAFGSEGFGGSSLELQRWAGERLLRSISSDGSSRFSLKAPDKATL